MKESTKMMIINGTVGVIIVVAVILIIVFSIKHKHVASQTMTSGIPGATTATTSSKYSKSKTISSGAPMTATVNSLTPPGPGTVPVAPATSADGVHFGYIKSITTANGVTNLVIDYVALSNCPASAVAGTCVGGYLVSNSSNYLRTFPVSVTAPITVQTFSTDKTTGQYNFNQDMTEYVFASLFNTPLPYYNPKNLIYEINLKNQEVISIAEVYKMP